jgi:cell division protein FtsW (lipid II flippase)
MVAETEAIGRAGPRLRFAVGCLWAAVSHRLSMHFTRQEPMMHYRPTEHPRRFASYCAAGAVGLGLSYMAVAGAPAFYLVMNGAAFLLGLLALGVIVEAGRIGRVPPGLVSMVLATILLAVSLGGVSANGVSRWISVGGVLLQPSLILVPSLVLGFVRSRDGLSGLAVMIAALALALQPDRAMAAALAAGSLSIALTRRGWLELAAIAAAVMGFIATMIRPDLSPAMPFVDQILFSSFAVHPVAGLALWCGTALMLVPAVVGLARDPHHRAAYAAFVALWLAVIGAAALGNYPTPLVGYGGSAILGYLISLIGLPRRTASAETGQAQKTATADPDAQRMLRARLA